MTREGEDPDQDKIVIVDEFTGRLMPDRTWRDGLHQAIEAKEQILINPPKDTYARVSFQRFFRMYRRLSGMTGTGLESRRELWRFSIAGGEDSDEQAVRAEAGADRVSATDDAKFAAIVQEIQRLHMRGQPVLVGTRSVKASERVSELLTNLGLEHQVLNAVRHGEEAQISRAGGGGGTDHGGDEHGRPGHGHQAVARGEGGGGAGGDCHRAA